MKSGNAVAADVWTLVSSNGSNGDDVRNGAGSRDGLRQRRGLLHAACSFDYITIWMMNSLRSPYCYSCSNVISSEVSPRVPSRGRPGKIEMYVGSSDGSLYLCVDRWDVWEVSLCPGEGGLHLRRLPACGAALQDSAGEALQQRYTHIYWSLGQEKTKSWSVSWSVIIY